jgi:DNA-binding FadR family transcriptional regulator
MASKTSALESWLNHSMTPPRLHQVAMRDLMGQIVRGELAPGDRLPKEVDLAEQYGISRGVARESIRGLEERNLIEVRHGRGQQVTDPREWDLFDVEVLAAMLENDSTDLLLEVLEAQKIFEVQAAGIVADSGAPEAIASLAELTDRLADWAELAERSDVAGARFAIDRIDFHRQIVRASGNRALVGLAEPIYRALAEIRQGALSAADMRTEVGEYRQIVEALESGDEGAAMEAMDEHLSALTERLRGS